MMVLLLEIREYMLNDKLNVNLDVIHDDLKNEKVLSLHEKFRNTSSWVSYDGKRRVIKDISDEHLVNIIGHNFKINYYNERFQNSLIFEFFYRGLCLQMLKKFQIPHVNQNGEKVIMSYEETSLFQTIKLF